MEAFREVNSRYVAKNVYSNDIVLVAGGVTFRDKGACESHYRLRHDSRILLKIIDENYGRTKRFLVANWFKPVS